MHTPETLGQMRLEHFTQLVIHFMCSVCVAWDLLSIYSYL